MNKLIILQKMSFRVTWSLVGMGLFGNDKCPVLLTRADIVEYLWDAAYTYHSELSDDAISLICEKDDPDRFDLLLKELSNNDLSDFSLQFRKWRVFLLKELVDNISADPLQGLLELMEFWIRMGLPKDCPHEFPKSQDALQNYFSQMTYHYLLDKNSKWLSEEISDIIQTEADDSFYKL